ncbi:MAG: (5-formylfuran-3-yl)methyl phosphate synthase [Candidatus Omnitrophota bacterium]
MKALITVKNIQEAGVVLKSGCDILDIKNPAEGSLGASYPWVVKEIMGIVPEDVQTSIAIGDVPNLPGTISFAVWGALVFKPDYIKIGLKGTTTQKEAVKFMKHIVRTAKLSKLNTRIVPVCYADYIRTQTVNPFYIAEISVEAGAKVAMIDTMIKDGKTLLDFMSVVDLRKIVSMCHKRKIEAAFAGSLTLKHIEIIRDTGADIFGVRGAVCVKGDRESKLSGELTKKFYEKFK